MKVWQVTEEQIREAADEVGLRLYGWPNGHVDRDGRALRFRLSVNTDAERTDGNLPYQRLSQSRLYAKPRRIAAVCWHGHRDFMRALFERNPDARIKTALADYRGAADFEYAYSGTYGHGNDYNLGYGQACTCTAAVREQWERV